MSQGFPPRRRQLAGLQPYDSQFAACTAGFTGRLRSPAQKDRAGSPASLRLHRRHPGPPGGPEFLLSRAKRRRDGGRSEEHTSELQSLMRISYAVLCLKKKRIKYKTEEPD